MTDRILPGAMLGVLGGGQLGAMFAGAARRLGYRVAVWDPDPDAPAFRVADQSFSRPLLAIDQTELTTGLGEFVEGLSAATLEWENIASQVPEALEHYVMVRPAARVLKLLQNRNVQKRFLESRGLPVAPFRSVSSPDDLAEPDEIGFPCLCKTATAGYDGKGQWKIEEPEEVPAVQGLLNQQPRPPGGDPPWILEKFLAFEKELSVLIVRGADGDVRRYPVVENVHEAGILRTSRVPACVNPASAEEAASLAEAVVNTLDGVGVFCVELFLMPDGRLLINEIAPRPHNSGHYTLDACTVSQFEQQVRALCGLPLGDVRLLTPAVMVNLIGDDFARAIRGEAAATLLRIPGAKLHVYGKAAVRPRRKMGHVTFLAEKPEQAWDAALRLQRMLTNP
jgi:5-(carboxyamino)imidazole ribonucleotide synthase